MNRQSRLALRVLAAVAGVLLIGAGFLAVTRAEPGTRLTLQFTDTSGLYVGNDVQVIGVSIGKVTAIRPHGRRVDVDVTVNAPISSRAGAVIMQGSLVTDRFVEITPAYTSGSKLRDGATITLERTQSPANTDDIMSALDDLLVALDGKTKDGKSIGDLLDVGARQLDGKGAQISAALKASAAAMSTLDGNEDDLAAITNNLASLSGLLARRDSTLNRLIGSVTDSTTVLADQRQQLDSTLAALVRLSATTTAFVHDNRKLIGEDLDSANKSLKIAVDNKAGLEEAFDLNPLVAENLWRAFDPDLRRSRIRVNVRETGPFSDVVRSDICTLFLQENCSTLVNPDGTGALDPLFDLPTALFPRTF